MEYHVLGVCKMARIPPHPHTIDVTVITISKNKQNAQERSKWLGSLYLGLSTWGPVIRFYIKQLYVCATEGTRLGLCGMMTSKGKSSKRRAEQMKPEELPCFQSKFLELAQVFKRLTIWTHAPFLVPLLSTAVPDRGKAV